MSSGSDTEDALGVLVAEQAALRRVATLVASMLVPEKVFHTVAEEAGRLLGAKTGVTVRFAEQGGIVVGRWDEDDAFGFELGMLVPYSDPDAPMIAPRTTAVGSTTTRRSGRGCEDDQGGRLSLFGGRAHPRGRANVGSVVRLLDAPAALR